MDYGTLLFISSDEETKTSLNKLVFQPLRNEPILASNGRVGLEMALLYSPTAILLDETVPDCADFLIALLQSDCSSPVLLLTRDHSPDHLIASFRQGIKDFILLPLEPELAQKTLQEVLQWGCAQADRERLNRSLLSNEAVQITIATLSHYMNNYLTALSGNLVLLNEMADPEAGNLQLQKTLEDCQKNIQYINTVLRVLLNTTNIRFTNYDGTIPMIDIQDALIRELKYLDQGNCDNILS